jgi:glc operon protein GlcG
MPALTLETARPLVERALERAKLEFKRPICVALCDPLGFLIAFARMEGAPARSIQISQGKAYTAARMGVSTEAFLARLRKEAIEISYFCDPLLTALPGGSVLRDAAGTMVGAIGVSGLISAEDQQITDGIAELVKAGMDRAAPGPAR